VRGKPDEATTVHEYRNASPRISAMSRQILARTFLGSVAFRVPELAASSKERQSVRMLGMNAFSVRTVNNAYASVEAAVL
jgi:hypothetical protein